MDIITHSRLKSFRECQRKHKLRYLDEIVSATKSERLAVGSAFHSAAEVFWKTLKTGVGIDESILEGMNVLSVLPDLDGYATEMVRALFRGYAVSWSGMIDRYEILGVEEQFRAPLINPASMASSRTFEMHGKIDAILRDKVDGMIYLVEHKTTKEDISDDAADYWSRLTLDPQLSIYVIGAESLGYQISGIIYDVAKKPALRPMKATPVDKRKFTKEGKLYANQRADDETITEFGDRVRSEIDLNVDHYFKRRFVARLDHQLAANMADVWQLARQMRDAERSESAPMNPDACTRFGRCEYWDICANGVDLRFSTLYKSEPAHQELSVLEV